MPRARFAWETAPHQTQYTGQVCDVHANGRDNRLYARRIDGSRRFKGTCNGENVIAPTETIAEAKRDLEYYAVATFGLVR